MIDNGGKNVLCFIAPALDAIRAVSEDFKAQAPPAFGVVFLVNFAGMARLFGRWVKFLGFKGWH